jgi:hypothetical protein
MMSNIDFLRQRAGGTFGRSREDVWCRDMKRENMEAYNVSVEQLGQLGVYDQKGQKIILSDLWTSQSTVLVFVRHFG